MKKAYRPAREKEADKDRLVALTRESYAGVWSFDGKTLPEQQSELEIQMMKDTYIFDFVQFQEGNQCQTLLGVTGSGQTFTMANVIQQLNKPTLIIAHNKALAAQLYSEFKEFFSNNGVEYFVP